MKFNIYRASVIYGGGPSSLDFKVIHQNVTEDFVKGFFTNITLDKKYHDFRTISDSMGCYTASKVEVSEI